MFVAVYWWRVHPGSEAQFREAWRRGAAPNRSSAFMGVSARDFIGIAPAALSGTPSGLTKPHGRGRSRRRRPMTIPRLGDCPRLHPRGSTTYDEPVFAITVTDDLLTFRWPEKATPSGDPLHGHRIGRWKRFFDALVEELLLPLFRITVWPDVARRSCGRVVCARAAASLQEGVRCVVARKALAPRAVFILRT